MIEKKKIKILNAILIVNHQKVEAKIRSIFSRMEAPSHLTLSEQRLEPWCHCQCVVVEISWHVVHLAYKKIQIKNTDVFFFLVNILEDIVNENNGNEK